MDAFAVAEKIGNMFGMKLDKMNPDFTPHLRKLVFREFGDRLDTHDEVMRTVTNIQKVEEQRRKELESRLARTRKLLDEKLYTQREDVLAAIEEQITGGRIIKGKYRIEGALEALKLVRSYFESEDRHRW